MKTIFLSIKILLACFVVYYFLPSCKSTAKLQGKVLTGPIKITKYYTSNSSLKLRDNNNNDVSYCEGKRQQVINWNVVGTASQVLDIIAISPDPDFPNYPDFFSVPPHQQGTPKHWQATIANLDTTKGFLEKYYIKWKIQGDDSTYTYDPVIQLNPKYR